ncbi:MAG: hypothetical protein CJBNEKGG_03001 [Prosthecobacter sp.]|nr:hypothetical protein [Prosthecobacter sp.]
MKAVRLFLTLLIALLVASCSSIRPLSSKPPYSSIKVNKPFTWGDGVILIKVEMPSGEYKPLYEDDKGYYYQAPQKITGRDSFWPLLMDGGLFLKRNLAKPDQIYIIRNQYGIPTRINIGDRADVSLPR